MTNSPSLQRQYLQDYKRTTEAPGVEETLQKRDGQKETISSSKREKGRSNRSLRK